MLGSCLIFLLALKMSEKQVLSALNAVIALNGETGRDNSVSQWGVRREVFMKQPEGYTKPEEEHLVCKLSKSIYGLKQSPRCWNTALHAHLVKMNFEQLHSDPCIYRSKTEGDCFYIGVYVELAGKDEARIQEVKQMPARKFDIKDLGRPFFGMSVVQDQGALTTWIGRPAYIKKLLGKQTASQLEYP